MIIYRITNHVNDKEYIGMTVKTGKKFDKYWGSGGQIKKAIVKYGLENFSKEILQHCFTKEEMYAAEIYWINKLKPFVPNGYNVAVGGELFIKYDEQSRIIFGKNRTLANPDMYDKIRATRRKNGTNVFSEEHLKNITIANQNRAKDPKWLEKVRHNMVHRNPKELRYYIQNTITNEIIELVNIRGVKSYIFEYNEQMGYTNNKRCNHHLLCHLGHTRDFIMLKKERVNGRK